MFSILSFLNICKMYVNLAFAVTFAFITITWPAKTRSARNFNKFWNQSLVYIEGSPIISMTMPLRSECVTLCGLQPNCCCTQWVPSNNTCTILISDRVALSPNSLALSTIDSTSLNNILVLRYLHFLQ